MARIVDGVIVPEAQNSTSDEAVSNSSINLFGTPISPIVAIAILFFTLLIFGIRGLIVVGIMFAASYFIKQRSQGGSSNSYSPLSAVDENSRRKSNIKGIGDLPKKAAGC